MSPNTETATEKKVSGKTPAAQTETGPSADADRTYTVIFHSQEGPGGKDDIVVHVGNTHDIGHNWRFKRENEVQVPERAMRAIEDAKAIRYVMDEKAKRPKPTEVKRFAYTILKVE
jgi:hypothetical protein